VHIAVSRAGCKRTIRLHCSGDAGTGARYVVDVDSDPAHLTIQVRIDSEDERVALEQALLRARATELAEVRRNQVRLSAGYGDTTTRDAMGGEAGRAQLRWTMLDRLLSDLRRGDDASGET
jgi:hypothetical protein